jgi:hypothetical protein
VASVTSMTADAVQALVDTLVKSASIDGSSHLILTFYDDSTLDVGSFQATDADLTAIAALTPADDDVIQRKSGAWVNRTIAQLVSDILADGSVQAYDADLAAIAALTPADDDVVQRKAGAWANRTIAQLVTDIVDNGAFQASDSDLTAIAALTPADDDVVQRKSGAWVNRTIAQLYTDLLSTSPGGDFIRMVNRTAISSDSSSVSSETIVITTPSLTFKAGRAYRCTMVGRLTSSSGGDTGQIKVKQTDTSGVVIIDSYRIPLTSTNVSSPLQTFKQFFVNSSGADITSVIVVTLQRATGTGDITLKSTAGSYSYIEIEDVGLSSDSSYATAVALV